MSNTRSEGLSAVELLITLFIGFMFIMMGYQLFSVTIASGAATNWKGRASNLAYTQMRLSADTAFAMVPPANCPTASTTNTSVDSGKGTQTVTISCPNTAMYSNLRLVTVRVVYGSSQEEATHAVYVYQ